LTKHSKPDKEATLDSCVLIDFFKADKNILELIAKYVYPIYVVSPIIDEVNEIKNENELLDLGINIIEPEIEDAYLASQKQSPLSFPDRICLFVSKRYNYICVTNDKKLRKTCKQDKISVMWGLELILKLYSEGGILKKDAENFVKTIKNSNPKFINDKVFLDFMKKLKK